MFYKRKMTLTMSLVLNERKRSVTWHTGLPYCAQIWNMLKCVLFFLLLHLNQWDVLPSSWDFASAFSLWLFISSTLQKNFTINITISYIHLFHFIWTGSTHWDQSPFSRGALQQNKTKQNKIYIVINEVVHKHETQMQISDVHTKTIVNLYSFFIHCSL